MSFPSEVTCACACVISDAGWILAVTRRGTVDQWGLPGGKMNYGETPLEGAIRETKEETGLDLATHTQPTATISFGLREIDHIYTGPCYLGQRYNDLTPNEFEGADPDFVVTSTYLWKGRTSHLQYQELEEGIMVRWVPFPRLLEGPFGHYNMNLFQEILKRGSKYDWTK